MKSINLFVLFLLIIALTGCAGIQYQDQPQSVESLNYGKSRAKTKVLAKAEEWRSSGVAFEKGKSYSINARGRWTGGGTCGWTGPDGLGANNLLCPEGVSPIVRGWTYSALIGKIGENGVPFAIGSELTLSPNETGTLFLRINDTPGWCGDNDGYVDVNIALTYITDSLPHPASR